MLSIKPYPCHSISLGTDGRRRGARCQRWWLERCRGSGAGNISPCAGTTTSLGTTERLGAALREPSLGQLSPALTSLDLQGGPKWVKCVVSSPSPAGFVSHFISFPASCSSLCFCYRFFPWFFCTRSGISLHKTCSRRETEAAPLVRRLHVFVWYIYIYLHLPT